MPNDEIQLSDEVAMRASFRRALKTWRGEGRQVSGLHGVVEEERLIGRALYVVGQPRLAFL